MNKEIKAQWTSALRSGDYKQGQSALHVGDHFCCLGVLCDLATKAGVVTEYREAGGSRYGPMATISLPAVVQIWADLDSSNPEVDDADLMWLNDIAHASFNAIADLIDEYL